MPGRYSRQEVCVPLQQIGGGGGGWVWSGDEEETAGQGHQADAWAGADVRLKSSELVLSGLEQSDLQWFAPAPSGQTVELQLHVMHIFVLKTDAGIKPDPYLCFQLQATFLALIRQACSPNEPSPDEWQVSLCGGGVGGAAGVGWLTLIFSSQLLQSSLPALPLRAVQPAHLGGCEQVLFPHQGATLEGDGGNEAGM